MLLTTITTEGYENLSNAIIVQALKDLERSEVRVEKFKKNKKGKTMSEEDKTELKGLEDTVTNLLSWFGSQDYYGYTSLHPDEVLQAYRDAHAMGHTMRMIGKEKSLMQIRKDKKRIERRRGGN